MYVPRLGTRSRPRHTLTGMTAAAPQAPDQASDLIVRIEGMHCAACVRRVERALLKVDGVSAASVDLVGERAVVTVADDSEREGAISDAVNAAGYHAAFADEESAEAEGPVPASTIAALVLGWGIFAAMQVNRWLELGWNADITFSVFAVASTVALAYGGRPILTAAWTAARQRTAVMDTLIVVGVGAAWAWSIAATVAPGAIESAGAERDVFFDTALIIVGFVSLGRHLEARVRRRAGDAAARMLALQPERALVLRGGAEVEVAVSEIARDEQLAIRPGDRFAVDGIVTEGRTTVNEALLTGESAPVPKEAGDRVHAGTHNLDGAVAVRATETGRDTALARIAAAVERAQASKAPIQRLADQIAAVFVPAVLAIAALTLVLWAAFGPEPAFSRGIVAAVAVLVVACPCALGLATPAAVAAAAGRSARFGALFRNAEALEAAGNIDTVVFDKTGTLTTGRHEVVGVETFGAWMEAGALALAAAVERSSEHPFAAAIERHVVELGIDVPAADDFQALPGRGATAAAAGKRVAVGSERLLEDSGAAVPATNAPPGASTVFVAVGSERVVEESDTAPSQGDDLADESAETVAIDWEVAAAIHLADHIRDDALEAVTALRARGIEVQLLTGDGEDAANAVAAATGITDVRFRVLPQDKLHRISALQLSGRKVAMVGDGVNDAPALARAEVGIALRTGADIAVDAADVTLANSSPATAASAILLARRARRTIRQNLAFAFIYNIILIPLAAGAAYPIWSGNVPESLNWLFTNQGALEPIAAGLAMSLSSISVITNALRLQRWRAG